MAILTKDPVTKGSPATFTLDVAELMTAVASLPDSSYYATYQNVKHVNFIYNSNPGNQKEVVAFDLRGLQSAGSVEASFSVSSTARDVFEIESIILIDADGGFFRILRSQLDPQDAAAFDVDMSV